jgi:hypothetical protein
MSGQNWSILITPATTDGGPAVYTPNLPDQTPGEPLQAGNADIISWNNRTSDEHQPWPVVNGRKLTEEEAKAQGLYLSDVIPARTSSTPGYVTTATAGQNVTIEYTCTFHPDEHASIVVWPQ